MTTAPNIRLHRFQSLFLAGMVAASSWATAARPPPAGTNWALTFADEFNAGTTLDSMKWSNGHPWDTSSSKAGNISVSGGILNLNAVREPYDGGQFSGVGVATRPPWGRTCST